MTLQSAVTARISDELLIQLTNQDTRGTGLTVNTAVLAAAVADAQAEFSLETAITFVDTDPQHLWAGVKGVLYYLHAYSATQKENTSKLKNEWLDALNKIARTLGGERRIMPKTDSQADPSQRRAGYLPDEDRQRWDSFVPRPNRSGVEDGDPWRH